MCILVQTVKWEQAYPSKLDGTWQDAFQVKDANETKLLGSILDSIPRCVDQYFTVLYGMYPRFVVENLYTDFSVPLPPLKKVADPLEGAMSQINKETVASRLKQLLVSHRAHAALAEPVSADQTTAGPWFRTLEPSETIIECFQLKIDSTAGSPTDKSSSLNAKDVDASDTISLLLKINNILHMNMDKPRLLPGDVTLDKLYSIKAFYYILLNEAFFKECMRQYHMMHIRRLRKRLIEMSMQAGRLNVLLLIRRQG
jgi:hypothetical protein